MRLNVKTLLRVDSDSGAVETVLGHRSSESFKSLNDLGFDERGRLYFTDQGQSGLNDPMGRVYHLRTDGGLNLLIANAPSPNGIALDRDARFPFVAVMRSMQSGAGRCCPTAQSPRLGPSAPSLAPADRTAWPSMPTTAWLMRTPV